MKKLMLAALIVVVLASCSTARKWTDKERTELRTELRNYKEKSFLRHMQEKEYTNVEDCVVATIEETFPDYNQYMQLSGKTDTLILSTVECVDNVLGANYANLPLLFPYAQLQTMGVLPSPMSMEQVGMFYLCLTAKLQAVYPSSGTFLLALMNDPAASESLALMIQECGLAITLEWNAQNPNAAAAETKK